MSDFTRITIYKQLPIIGPAVDYLATVNDKESIYDAKSIIIRFDPLKDRHVKAPYMLPAYPAVIAWVANSYLANVFNNLPTNEVVEVYIPVCKAYTSMFSYKYPREEATSQLHKLESFIHRYCEKLEKPSMVGDHVMAILYQAHKEGMDLNSEEFSEENLITVMHRLLAIDLPKQETESIESIVPAPLCPADSTNQETAKEAAPIEETPQVQ